MWHKIIQYGVTGMAALLLSACAGDYDGSVGGQSASGSVPQSSGSFSSPEDFFAKRVQPRLSICRTCHVPTGVANVEDGKLLMFNPSDRSEDYPLLLTAWEALGGNAQGESRILLMASGRDARTHSGGDTLWPVGSPAYQDVKTMLGCFESPQGCLNNAGGGEAVVEKALLGSRYGGHYWFDYCEGQPDDTPVPEDPRHRVVPGVNQGKAVLMNAWWQTCQEGGHPGTCGELRARQKRGFALIASDGEIGAGNFFAGSSNDSTFAFGAEKYNDLWKRVTDLPQRPDNFDELMAQRWGMPLSKTHNPYPLPGEDPNLTDGGSGQLPMGLTQLREADGRWTGKLNVTCSICHGGGVGSIEDAPDLGPVYGTNSLSDITLMFTDLGMIAPQQSALALISQNKVRGTGNITNFQLFGTLTLLDRDNLLRNILGYASIQTQPSTGTEDPPVYWNMGSRSGKFYDGGEVMDAKRIALSFHFPNTPFHPDMDADKQWILDSIHDADAWMIGLKAPRWPEHKLGQIDVALAEQGAVLFHAKDLWAKELNNPEPRPEGGNGSCASCHGAYSPRYVHDPAYLDTPLLEGIASYITPLEIIKTDPRRIEGNSMAVVRFSRSNWFAYGDAEKNANGAPLCGNQADPLIRGDRALGYLAPPMYGVWASAPYLHNGSVPTIWQVLKPQDRPAIWQRHSMPARADQEGKVVMGFDYRLEAYDAEQLGWKYDTLSCGTGSMPFYDCNQSDSGLTLQDALGLVWANGGLAWNLLNLPVLTPAQIEARKVYNTFYYSQSNAGHAFTSVLTDDERRALIEYLKTL